MRKLCLYLVLASLLAACIGGAAGSTSTTEIASPDNQVAEMQNGPTPRVATPEVRRSPEEANTDGTGAGSMDASSADAGLDDDVATETTLMLTPSSPLAAPFITVTVQQGDTLLGLALQYSVPMAAIQLQNDLGSSTLIRLGQQLVIPPRSAWEGAAPFWILHVVSEGETLSAIGKTYGLTVADLQGANGLADVDRLSIGQPLVLPLRDFFVAQAPQPTPRPTAAATAAAAQAPATQAPASAPVAIAPPPSDVGQWPYETVRIINEVRAAHGLPPLTYNETLAQAAQIQANDCAERGWCSHTGSDGSDIKARVLRVGYSPASWAECWAIRLTPQGAVDIWMDEIPPNDPHRRTLLTTWLNEIGIGVAKAHWGYYFIAVFGRPLR